MKIILPEKQGAALAFIEKTILKTGHGPTASEIGNEIGGGRQNALQIVRNLERKGFLSRKKDANGNAIPRSFKITPKIN